MIETCGAKNCHISILLCLWSSKIYFATTMSPLSEDKGHFCRCDWIAICGQKKEKARN